MEILKKTKELIMFVFAVASKIICDIVSIKMRIFIKLKRFFVNYGKPFVSFKMVLIYTTILVQMSLLLVRKSLTVTSFELNKILKIKRSVKLSYNEPYANVNICLL